MYITTPCFDDLRENGINQTIATEWIPIHSVKYPLLVMPLHAIIHSTYHCHIEIYFSVYVCDIIGVVYLPKKSFFLATHVIAKNNFWQMWYVCRYHHYHGFRKLQSMTYPLYKYGHDL